MKPQRPPQLPFARSYWVVPGKLLAGFLPGDRDPFVAKSRLESLLNCGISHITNLMEEDESDPLHKRKFTDYTTEWFDLGRIRGEPVTWERSPTRDLGIPRIDQMIATLDLLDEVLAEDRAAYVHCWGGKGRTGTVIGCWLARHGETDPLGKLRQLTAHARIFFPVIPETAQQRTFVQNWKEDQ